MADNFLISSGAGPSSIRAVDLGSGLYVPVHVGSSTTFEAISSGLTQTAYTTGDAVGGLLTFTNVSLSSGRPIIVKTANLVQTTLATVGTPQYTLLFFNSPLTTTTVTDNAALSITAADIVNTGGYTSFSSSKNVGGGTVYTTNANLQVSPTATTLYGVLIADSGFTLGSIAATGIRVILEVDQL